MQTRVKQMLPLIIISVIATIFAIGVYQYVIHKYYWGPKGPPQKRNKRTDAGEK
jgi:hypothetical protein